MTAPLNPLIHDATPVLGDNGDWYAFVRVTGFGSGATGIADCRAWCKDMNEYGELVLTEIEVKLETG